LRESGRIETFVRNYQAHRSRGPSRRECRRDSANSLAFEEELEKTKDRGEWSRGDESERELPVCHLLLRRPRANANVMENIGFQVTAHVRSGVLRRSLESRRGETKRRRPRSASSLQTTRPVSRQLDAAKRRDEEMVRTALARGRWQAWPSQRIKRPYFRPGAGRRARRWLRRFLIKKTQGIGENRLGGISGRGRSRCDGHDFPLSGPVATSSRKGEC